ncbi:MAG: DUF2089 domain-containing protein [Chloroflexi bacterium]|nr:DUF2089 domain-containing protein [Chloroflexota bacterium]
MTDLAEQAMVRLPHSGRVRVQAVSGNLLAKYVEGSLTIEEYVSGEAIIRHCGEVAINGDVHSGVRLKHIAGLVTVQDVNDDVQAKYVRSIAFSHVSGDVQAAYIGGDVTAEEIHGNLRLRSVDGLIAVNAVHGDAVIRTAPAGARIAQVHGDLTLRTEFNPGAMYEFEVRGTTRIRVPAGANVRIVMPHSTDLNLDNHMQAHEEGESTIVTLGTGAATVELRPFGPVIVTQRGGYAVDDEYHSPLDEELTEELSSLSEQMDEQMSRLDTILTGMGGRIRERVERKLNIARRRVQEAQERVEALVEQAAFEDPGVIVTVNEDPQTNSEERMAVLKMLENGTISVQEAEQLLAALGD